MDTKLTYINMDFEHYLMKVHMEQHPMLLDDDLVDAFNDWLAEEPVDNIIQYAENWHKKLSSAS